MKKKRQESKEIAYYERKGKKEVTDELVLLSYNVRGLNQEGKQDALYKIVQQERPHLICFNETKL